MVREKYNLLKNLFHFWTHLNPLKKQQSIYIFFLMFINSFLEMLSIGAVFPFIGALTSPDLVFQNSVFIYIFDLFDLNQNDNITIIFTFVFISLVSLACIFRLIVLYIMTRFSFSLGVDVGYKIYKHTLYQPFLVHVNRNSSVLINAIVTQTETVVFSVIISFLTLCNSIIMLLGVGIVLCVVNLKLTIIAITFFIILYSLIMLVTKKKLRQSGKNVAEKGSELIKALQEGFGGIRDIIIDGSQLVHLRIFNECNKILKRSMGNIQIISGSPRFIIEGLGMIAIAFAALIASESPNGILNSLPIIGTLALGAQRLLPVLQEAFRNLSVIKGTEASLLDVLDFLDQEMPNHQNILQEKMIIFNKSITLKNIQFRYSKLENDVFKNLNYSFLKGKRIGIIGETGVGKSTFVDIVMGLLESNKGSIYIDKAKLDHTNLRSWQKQIAHVPQNIFLTDGTIYQNIAFGVEEDKVDDERLKNAAKDAQLDKFVRKLPYGYQTNIGETGIKLSGGQKQRIGIARALYKKAKIIIFDEATNSLDGKTEKLIMDTIYRLNKDLTLIIIAHRLSTLSRCDEIIEIKNNKITKK